MKLETLMDRLERFGREREVRIEVKPSSSPEDTTPSQLLTIDDVIIAERNGERVVIIKADIN